MKLGIHNLLSLNVRGLGNGIKRRGLFHWLKKYHNGKNSIIFLQETHSTPEIETLWKKEYASNILFSHGKSNCRGVAILLPKDTELNVVNVISSPTGRYIAMEISLENESFLFLNVYAPTRDHPNEQVTFMEDLFKVTERYAHCSLLVGGDMNMCLDPSLDKHGEPDKSSKYRNHIKEYCDHFNIIDIWRVQNPDTRRYTWRQSNPLRQSRIDYFFISTHLLYNISQTDIAPSYKSDHSLIVIKFIDISAEGRGPGYWKFNNLLLQDEVYIDYIKGWLLEYDKMYSYIEDKSLL